MKSLSILILAGTLSALIIGGIFAVTPVLAEAQPQPVSEEIVSGPVQAVAPVTGDAAAIELAAPVTELSIADPAIVSASTFTVSLEKDWTALEIQPEIETVEVAVESASNLQSFVASVLNGQADQITGIYADGLMAYEVVRQPKGNLAYVSADADDITLFDLAAQYGTQAFLAHNYLAGASFSELDLNMIITLVYGDGHLAYFRVADIHEYQALSPDSTQSNFVDLETGQEISNSTLFNQMYNNNDAIVFQTCITREGNTTWGRLFVEAVPASEDEVKAAQTSLASAEVLEPATSVTAP